MEPSDVPDPSATVLYVGNLDRRVTESMMVNILRTGLPRITDRVLSANMSFTDPSHGAEGYCFVQFADNNAACQAMTFLNGRDFCGKTVKVNWATNSTNGPPKVIGTSVTIFVGDLDDEITDGELRQAFDPFGEILNAKVVRDAATNKSKNYGFISFNNKPDAERAIRDMHGAMLRRRPIKTNWATRNQNSKPSQLDYDQVYKETSTENCTVYVTNLPDRITEEMLLKHFEPYGKIIGNVRLFEGKNFAFIRYESHAAAATSIVKANGSELNGAILKCWWGKESDNNVTSSNRSNTNSSYSQNNYNNQNNAQQQQQQPQPQDNQTQMAQQQYMQLMQQYAPYYQQQYYQYWVQQQYMQRMQQQQQQQQGGAAQQQSYPYQYNGYSQQGWQGQQQQQPEQQQQQGYQAAPQTYQN